MPEGKTGSGTFQTNYKTIRLAAAVGSWTIARMKALSWIALSWAIALPAVAQKSSSKPPAYTPEQATARMTLPDGFKVTQFAAEPHVVQPFAFALIPAVACGCAKTLNYETRRSDTFKEGPKGRIIILEDTDGDGHFDKKKVFADKLFFPHRPTSGLRWRLGRLAA